MEDAASTSLVYLSTTIYLLLQSSYMGTGYGGLDSAHEGVDRVLPKYAWAGEV